MHIHTPILLSNKNIKYNVCSCCSYLLSGLCIDFISEVSLFFDHVNYDNHNYQKLIALAVNSFVKSDKLFRTLSHWPA